MQLLEILLMTLSSTSQYRQTHDVSSERSEAQETGPFVGVFGPPMMGSDPVCISVWLVGLNTGPSSWEKPREDATSPQDRVLPPRGSHSVPCMLPSVSGALEVGRPLSSLTRLLRLKAPDPQEVL